MTYQASPNFMSQVGPIIKLVDLLQTQPLHILLDQQKDASGRFLNSKEAQERLGLPFLVESGDPETFIRFAVAVVEKMGLTMPTLVWQYGSWTAEW
jgi:hypothetical protein